MRIGIYGGSFNPIHFGHIGLVKWVAENTDLDEVWMIISPNNPLKDKNILADEHDRLEGAKEAIKDLLNSMKGRSTEKRIKVSDFEFNLPRPTYTANTLRALAEEYPEHEFTLIIGEDNLTIFDKWREYQYIMDNYRIFVYPRRGTDKGENLSHIEHRNVIFLENAPYFDISSTDLRKQKSMA